MKELKDKTDSQNCVIVGKSDDVDENDVPDLVDTVFEKEKTMKELRTVLDDVDVVIIEILKTEPQEIEDLLNYFEENYSEKEKRIIFISSPMLWYHTRDECLDSEEKSDPKKVTVFTDSDFNRRKTLPSYEIYKMYEDKLIYLSENNASLKTSVLIPGFLYGRGEDLFYDIFVSVFEKRESLMLLNDGNNIIPTIHVEDLIKCLIVLLQPGYVNQQVTIATDSAFMTQKELIDKVKQTFDINGLECVDGFNRFFMNNYEEMSINMKLQRSKVFETDTLVTEFSDNINPHRIKENNGFSFENGLIDNFLKVFDEFAIYGGFISKKFILQTNELFLENNAIVDYLTNKYNFKCLTSKYILDEVFDKGEDPKNTVEAECLSLINNFLEEKKQAIFEANMEEYEKNLKQKKKGIEEPLLEEIELDKYNDLSTEIILEIVLKFINKPIIKYMGCLLLNYPSTLEETELFFEKLAEDKLGFEEVLFIDPDTDLLNEKINDHNKFGAKDPTKKIEPEQLEVYKQLTELPLKKEIHDVFVEKEWSSFYCKVDKKQFDLEFIVDKKGIVEEESFIDEEVHLLDNNNEAKGEVNNLEASVLQNMSEVVKENPIEKKKTLLDAKIESKLLDVDRPSNKENTIGSRLDFRAGSRLDLRSEESELKKLIRQEEQKFHEKSMNIKQYLADNILPFVTEALIEICKTKPNDPIEKIIDFLKKKDSKEEV